MTDSEYIDAFYEEYWAQIKRGGVASLNKFQRMCCCLTDFQVEVNNGGLHQFLSNSSGQFAKETPAIMREIGAFRAAEILEEVNSMLGPNGPMTDRDERLKQLERLTQADENRIDELDRVYFKDEDHRLSLGELFDNYLLQTPYEFGS
jgi:hypothetical protein